MFDKDIISREAKIDRKEILMACPAKYFGGILKYPTKKFEQGSLGVTKDHIIFVNNAILKRNKIILRIPFKKIIFEEISQSEKEDLDSGNFYTAMSYFAGYGPMSTYKKNIKLIRIPFKDENNVKQVPVFSIKNIKEFGKLIYDMIPKYKKKEQIEDDPLKILKLRYAKGEISKKEFEELKKDLL